MQIGRLAVCLGGLGTEFESSGETLHQIPICVTGTWAKNGHKFSITAEDLAAMVRNFNKRKNSQIVIDYEHASEQPEVSKGGPIPAAGWIHDLSEEDTELRALVEWTPLAAELIASGQYRFFSPAIDWNFTDKETGESQGATLTSGALTNHPFLEELPPITLTEYGAVLLADVSTGYLDGPARTSGQGAIMKSKELSVKKMNTDAFEGAQGHHGVFDGANFVGHIRADDMKDYVRSCMGDGYGGFDDLVPRDADWRAKGQVGQPGHQVPDSALRDSTPSLSAELRESDPIGAEVTRKAKLVMREKGISFGKAMKNVLSADPKLAQQYRERPVADPDFDGPATRRPADELEFLADIAAVMKKEGISWQKAREKVLLSKRR
jgi:hypothetical protein